MTTMNNEDPADPSVHERQDAYRCIAPACKPLGCSDCNCAVRADVYAALGRSFGDAERERWERALKQTWQAIDPLKPAGQPGSYARGYDNGFAAALQVLRGNLGAQSRSSAAPSGVGWNAGLAVSLEKRHNVGTMMTTKVKIGLAQKHMPVVIEVVRSDDTVGHTMTLTEIGQEWQEYVHSGQTLRVRELTTQEAHDAGLQG